MPCCQGCQPRAVLQVLPIDGGAQRETREAREAASAARLRAEVETLRSELALAKTRLDAAEETNRCRIQHTLPGLDWPCDTGCTADCFHFLAGPPPCPVPAKPGRVPAWAACTRRPRRPWRTRRSRRASGWRRGLS